MPYFDNFFRTVPDTKMAALPVSGEKLRQDRPEKHGAPIYNVPDDRYESLTSLYALKIILMTVMQSKWKVDR